MPTLTRRSAIQLRNNGQYVKYDSPDSAKFLQITEIAAGPGFSKGWSELKLVPGAYVKAALRFDYGSYNEIVSALEVGISADYYSKKIQLMAHETPKQFFFTGYVAIIFGRRK